MGAIRQTLPGLLELGSSLPYGQGVLYNIDAFIYKI